MKYARAVVVLISVLSALWLTFVHPPLVLTAGPGDYTDARTHCKQNAEQAVEQQTGEFDDLFKESADKQKRIYQNEYERCMSNASARISHLLLQIAVIVLSTAALLWATRFLQ